MKLFQIEEPEGGPADPSAPGAAIGIDATGTEIQVAFSVGGNALILNDREGFERRLAVPAASYASTQWQESFEAARVRAERALARPVTHAVIVLSTVPEAEIAEKLHKGAEGAGLQLLRLAGKAELPVGSVPATAAAMLAEDLMPRPAD